MITGASQIQRLDTGRFSSREAEAFLFCTQWILESKLEYSSRSPVIPRSVTIVTSYGFTVALTTPLDSSTLKPKSAQVARCFADLWCS